MEQFIFTVGAFIVIALLAAVFRRRPRATVIPSPILGILDLSSGSSAAAISGDRTAIGQFFSSVLESSGEPPACNALFIYCHVEPDGSIRNTNSGLREIIRDSGAAIVVIATENASSAYIAAAKKTGYGHANLVMTLGRRGDIFPSFFQQLFTHMKRGLTMPVAWVTPAPQIPGHDHANCPETIFACEAGEVAFQ